MIEHCNSQTMRCLVNHCGPAGEKTTQGDKPYGHEKYSFRYHPLVANRSDQHKGESGVAYWRTQQFDTIRVRMVEYSPGYLADHWCTKGHILLCLEGELHTELADGRKFILTPGISYQVADDAEPHRSYTTTGVKLFIVD